MSEKRCFLFTFVDDLSASFFFEDMSQTTTVSSSNISSDWFGEEMCSSWSQFVVVLAVVVFDKYSWYS